MLVRFKKTRDGVVLTCLRSASRGGAAVQRSAHGGFFALHDLMHYAAETTLGRNRSFFGLLASGWDFSAFSDHDDQRYRTLPDEARTTEHLVAVLSRHAQDPAELGDDLLPLLTDEINRELVASLADSGLEPPVLTPAQVHAIFDRFANLARAWAATPIGDHLELLFPDPDTPTPHPSPT